MRLAILGDTHYTNPAYHKEALAGRSRSPTAQVDVRRHAWTTQYILPQVIEQVRAAQPDVVLQLGDTNQGHCDDADGDVAELQEALDFFRQIGRPLLFARGTHEGRPNSPADAAYRKTFLAEIARTLRVSDGQVGTSYVFAAAGVRLIMLDYTTFARHSAADYLLQEHLARGAAAGERLFVCGHPPLIPIGRPFFSRLEYATAVLERIASAPAPVDAYFCGHTHNQVATFHRLVPGGGWLPQLQGAPVGYLDQPPVLLASVRAALPPPETLRYGWGYLEDSYPGWFLVDVEDGHVRARWQMVGRQGDHGEVRWSRAGEPEIVAVPPAPDPAPIPAWPLTSGDQRVTDVRLRAAGMGSRAPHRIWLNGAGAGVLPALEYFDGRQGVTLPESIWPVLQMNNRLVIEPAASEERCLGGFVLELTLRDGRVARSQVDPGLYATSQKWEPWRWCTPELRVVDPAAVLSIPLNFIEMAH